MSAEPTVIITESSEPATLYSLVMNMKPDWNIYFFGDGTRFLYGMCYPNEEQCRVVLSVFDASLIEPQLNGKLFITSYNLKKVETNLTYSNRETALSHEEFKRLWDIYKMTPLETKEIKTSMLANRTFDVLLF